MLLLICLHYLDFSRAGLCMLQIWFALATATCMCTRRGAPRGCPQKLLISSLPLVRTTWNFQCSWTYYCVLCCPVGKLNARAEKISASGLWGVVYLDTVGRLPPWSFAQVRSAAINQNLHSLCVDLLAVQKLLVWVKYIKKYKWMNL